MRRAFGYVEEKAMSVRMALAQLCAAACGGALIGGGAVHVAATPRPEGVMATKGKKTVAKKPPKKPPLPPI